MAFKTKKYFLKSKILLELAGMRRKSFYIKGNGSFGQKSFKIRRKKL
jgi:hypothetical protein